MISQVQCINGPAPNSWEDYNQMAKLTYHGGYDNVAQLRAFHHGIDTMCRLFSEELPSISNIREAQELRQHNERLIEELLTNGSGWDRESLLAFIRNPPSKAEPHERNTITCPCCGERTVVDTRCVEDCDECGVPIAYSVKPYNERAT